VTVEGVVVSVWSVGVVKKVDLPVVGEIDDSVTSVVSLVVAVVGDFAVNAVGAVVLSETCHIQTLISVDQLHHMQGGPNSDTPVLILR